MSHTPLSAPPEVCDSLIISPVRTPSQTEDLAAHGVWNLSSVVWFRGVVGPYIEDVSERTSEEKICS
jgi:hypothetical protein